MEITDHTSPPVKEDPLRKRYLYKLGTNLIGFALSLITAGIIPRGLGPTAYGNFYFLNNFFNQVANFLDLGTSMAFYTKISRRPQETELIRFYWGFASLISLVMLLAVWIALTFGLESWLWPDQTMHYIWMAAILGLLTWYSTIVNYLVDAYALTTKTEIVRIQQRLLGVILIVLMLRFSLFSLDNFFLYNYAIVLFACVGWWRVMNQAGLSILPTMRLPFSKVKNYVREFYEYTAPLIVFAVTSLLVNMLDRWLLQRFAGSIQQGFFSLSYKIGAICFLFTSAMTPLLTREFATAFGRQDIKQMQSLFRRYVPTLYTLAAFLAVFVAVQADKVSLIFGGSEYQGATLAVSIMAFYPIHQTYGQLTSSLLWATGQTKVFRNLGVAFMLAGLPVSFWLVAPPQLLGLNLGATGLAIKMVALQFVGVNLYLWFNVRFLHLHFRKFLYHQLYSLAVLASIAWLASRIVNLLVTSTLIAFLISGFFYTLGVGIATLVFPALLLMSRSELMNYLANFRLTLKRLRT